MSREADRGGGHFGSKSMHREHLKLLLPPSPLRKEVDRPRGSTHGNCTGSPAQGKCSLRPGTGKRKARRDHQYLSEQGPQGGHLRLAAEHRVLQVRHAAGNRSGGAQPAASHARATSSRASPQSGAGAAPAGNQTGGVRGGADVTRDVVTSRATHGPAPSLVSGSAGLVLWAQSLIKTFLPVQGRLL